jgi:hypothetical protein
MSQKTIEERAQKFFFKGMLAGYASGTETSPHPTLPGWKQFICTDNIFTLIDSWCDKSGYTQILYMGTLIWVMHYEGTYTKEDGVIQLLKAALHDAYSNGNFMGGRGPKTFTLDGLKKYINTWRGFGFRKFAGEELIFDPRRPRGEQRFGQHAYSGMLLVPPGLILP